MIGNALAEGHDLATAKPILEEAVKRFRELGDAHGHTIRTSDGPRHPNPRPLLIKGLRVASASRRGHHDRHVAA